LNPSRVFRVLNSGILNIQINTVLQIHFDRTATMKRQQGTLQWRVGNRRIIDNEEEDDNGRRRKRYRRERGCRERKDVEERGKRERKN
ncbi:hypothetical protein QT533_22455, partial [Xanthomonas citri pv. citri]